MQLALEVKTEMPRKKEIVFGLYNHEWDHPLISFYSIDFRPLLRFIPKNGRASEHEKLKLATNSPDRRMPAKSLVALRKYVIFKIAQKNKHCYPNNMRTNGYLRTH